MMYGSGSGGMMGGAGWLGALIWIIVLVDLVLAGVWLWQHVSKK